MKISAKAKELGATETDFKGYWKRAIGFPTTQKAWQFARWLGENGYRYQVDGLNVIFRRIA